MTTIHNSSTEVSEEIVQSSGPDVDRRERVQVVRDAEGVREERVVEDIGAERRSILSKVNQFIWLATGILEALIGMRFLLKLIAANPNSPFAAIIYNITDLFLWPFLNLTVSPAASNGMVLEINALIAMIVYALLAWALTKFIYLIFTPSRSRSVSVYQRDRI
jgi:hypothetical protein